MIRSDHGGGVADGFLVSTGRDVRVLPYYSKQVVKEWSLSTVYKSMGDFMVIQVIAVVLVLSFPDIAMWFPGWMDSGERVMAPFNPEEEATSKASGVTLESGDTMPAEADKPK